MWILCLLEGKQCLLCQFVLFQLQVMFHWFFKRKVVFLLLLLFL